MDKHHLMLKVSRLFPSSCHFRTLPDVAESSITITKTNKVLPENDLSSSFNKSLKQSKIPKNPSRHPNFCKTNAIAAPFPVADGRRCPPVTPNPTVNPKRTEKFQRKSSLVSINHSSSSNSGWFTSSDEKTPPDDDVDTFFSLSSNSGDSFRLKTCSRRFRRCGEMKSIDETGRFSFSSAASFDTVPSKCSRRITTRRCKTTVRGSKKPGKTWPECEMTPEYISTQMYYHNNRHPETNFRRRKTKKYSSRRSFDYSSMIGESYAVEKSSSDPQSDFRASMVEMIVEKQIFAAEDLERLLLCFLSLNAVSYHGMIFDVFKEICQTLFRN